MRRHFFILKCCLFFLSFTFFQNRLKSNSIKIETGIKDQIAFIYAEELRIATKDGFNFKNDDAVSYSKNAKLEKYY